MKVTSEEVAGPGSCLWSLHTALPKLGRHRRQSADTFLRNQQPSRELSPPIRPESKGEK